MHIEKLWEKFQILFIIVNRLTDVLKVSVPHYMETSKFSWSQCKRFDWFLHTRTIGLK